MRRYARIYRQFFVTSFTRELEFRANFIAKILQNAGWVIFFLLILLVIYSQAEDIAGWTRGESFILMGTIFFVTSLMNTMCISLFELPQMVRIGNLDSVLTRPVDAQFWVSLRKFDFGMLGSMLGGLAMAIYGITVTTTPITPANALGFALAVPAGFLMSYAIFFGMMSLAIHFVRIDNLWVLAETTNDIGRYPLDIYPFGVRTFFTFFLPVAALSYTPTQILLGDAPIWHAAIGWAYALAGLAITRWFWVRSLSRYTSASS